MSIGSGTYEKIHEERKSAKEKADDRATKMEEEA